MMRKIRRATVGLMVRVGVGLVGVGLATTSYAQEIYWQGEAACGDLFETPLMYLPGGAPLRTVSHASADGLTLAQAVYDLPHGGTLRLSGPEVRTFPVRGATFAEAWEFLLERRPLQDNSRNWDYVTLAQVKQFPRTTFQPKKVHEAPDGTPLYSVRPGSLKLMITPRVYLAEWEGYAEASAEDQDKWDRKFCESAHHELGHILVALRLMEAMDISDMPEGTRESLYAAFRTRKDRLVVDIREGQALYHAEVEAMGEALADSRPFVELPFSWLSNSRPEGSGRVVYVPDADGWIELSPTDARGE